MALILLLGPPALLLVYAVVPPPVTPLMLARLLEGEGMERRWVPLEKIAPAAVLAVLAAEDNRFCRHFGFDLVELQNVVEEYRRRGRLRGASTVTMQTAKNLLLWHDRSFFRKALEAVLTAQLEVLWSKRRIVEVYLNIAEWGPGLYGIGAAAERYFGKAPADLTAREAALLAVVLPSPRQWSPARPTPYLERRAGTIQTRMEQIRPLTGCAIPHA